jgi:hypothetical protein
MNTLCFSITSSLDELAKYTEHHKTCYCDMDIMKQLFKNSTMFGQLDSTGETISIVNIETSDIETVDKQYTFENIYQELIMRTTPEKHYLVITRNHEIIFPAGNRFGQYMQILTYYDMYSNDFLSWFNEFKNNYSEYSMFDDLYCIEMDFCNFFDGEKTHNPSCKIDGLTLTRLYDFLMLIVMQTSISPDYRSMIVKNYEMTKKFMNILCENQQINEIMVNTYTDKIMSYFTT